MSKFADLLLEAVKVSEIQNQSTDVIPNKIHINSNDKKTWLDTLADTATRGLPPRQVSTTPIPMNFMIDYNSINERRPRAMSEPVTSEDSWMNALKLSHHSQSVLPIIDELSSSTILPHANEKYSSIYNKNGRIGLYTREERNSIIKKYHEKRLRRVWTKKIRYSCRKNLADRRVRIKGRFVKGAVASSSGSIPNNGSNSSSSYSAMNTISNAGDLIIASNSKGKSSNHYVSSHHHNYNNSSSNSNQSHPIYVVSLSKRQQQKLSIVNNSNNSLTNNNSSNNSNNHNNSSNHNNHNNDSNSASSTVAQNNLTITMNSYPVEHRPRASTMTTIETSIDTDGNMSDNIDTMEDIEDSMIASHRLRFSLGNDSLTQNTSTHHNLIQDNTTEDRNSTDESYTSEYNPQSSPSKDSMNILASVAIHSSYSKSEYDRNDRRRRHDDEEEEEEEEEDRDRDEEDRDEDSFDEESEEQFLRDFLSGKLSMPARKKRRHTMV